MDKKVIIGISVGIIVIALIIVIVLFMMPSEAEFENTGLLYSAPVQLKDIGDNRILAKMPVDCQGRPITSFRFNNDDWNKDPKHVKYEYTCGDIKLDGEEGPYFTTTFNNMEKSTYALDEVRVGCGDKPLTSFSMIDNGDGTAKYGYTCGKNEMSDITPLSTASNDAGGGQNIYLDRHNVKCPKYKALSLFELEISPDKKEMRYDYKCGRIMK